MTRLIVAFLIAPVSVGILLTPVALVLTSGSEALWALKLNAVIGYPIAVVLGVPVWFAFSRLGWFSLRAYLLAGFAFRLWLWAACSVARISRSATERSNDAKSRSLSTNVDLSGGHHIFCCGVLVHRKTRSSTLTGKALGKK